MTPVETVLLAILSEHKNGLSEYDLIKELERRIDTPFSLSNPLHLFRTHFFVRHCLYRLRDTLWQKQAGHLVLSAISVRLHPYKESAQAIELPDPLRDYYLDLNNLEQTSEHDVHTMLGQFWKKFEAADDKQSALAALDLEEPVEFRAIEFRYRRLAQKHHPDKGGDADRLHEINSAWQTLKKYYRATG